MNFIGPSAVLRVPDHQAQRQDPTRQKRIAEFRMIRMMMTSFEIPKRPKTMMIMITVGTSEKREGKGMNSSSMRPRSTKTQMRMTRHGTKMMEDLG